MCWKSKFLFEQIRPRTLQSTFAQLKQRALCWACSCWQKPLILLVRSYYQFNTASCSKLRSEVWSGNLKYCAGRLHGNRLCRTFFLFALCSVLKRTQLVCPTQSVPAELYERSLKPRRSHQTLHCSHRSCQTERWLDSSRYWLQSSLLPSTSLPNSVLQQKVSHYLTCHNTHVALRLHQWPGKNSG